MATRDQPSPHRSLTSRCHGRQGQLPALPTSHAATLIARLLHSSVGDFIIFASVLVSKLANSKFANRWDDSGGGGANSSTSADPAAGPSAATVGALASPSPAVSAAALKGPGASSVTVTWWLVPSELKLEDVIFSLVLDLLGALGALNNRTSIISLFILLEALCTALITLSGVSLFHLFRISLLVGAFYMRASILMAAAMDDAVLMLRPPRRGGGWTSGPYSGWRAVGWTTRQPPPQTTAVVDVEVPADNVADGGGGAAGAATGHGRAGAAAAAAGEGTASSERQQRRQDAQQPASPGRAPQQAQQQEEERRVADGWRQWWHQGWGPYTRQQLQRPAAANGDVRAGATRAADTTSPWQELAQQQGRAGAGEPASQPAGPAAASGHPNS
ncbi:hypothetical protein MNEG_4741 [Monoraphidium neglectum]|uniref:Uncharacterized protein n=1 Tax=Monoraphidium neglectum TaxID=145388 RepID=A0A0D2ND24_9CHLO|nr:hypothetical protein MNEG_4741 [Monoraphidium neglectum]KIZ03221.1 hypothetical protein MNEG_4741 [Monoraphidium neglectum]|eukprot:XP_013902240.1 hypothetical protein MNEG_4741 [Monoraphidium neglectum]